MGLFASVASLLNLTNDSAGKAKIREEIDLSQAVQAHINWKLRLQNYLDGKSDETLDPAIIGRDDQCELGQWILGAGAAHFHALEDFHQLRDDHARFHHVAANVVQHVQEDNHQAARIVLEGDYPRISHKVVLALTELHKAIED